MVVIIVVIVAVVLIPVILVSSGVLEAGFTGKTLWEWIDVVGIPVVVVIIAGLFGLRANRVEQRRNKEQKERDVDQAREATLLSYLEVMSNLILVNDLTTSEKDSPERAIAQAHTFTALRTLDEPRVGILLQFLKESQLINRDRNVISLYGTNLNKANLSSVDLSGTCLSGVYLKEAELFNANLSNADLSFTVLVGADLWEADLSNADLRNADLTDALVEREQLETADISGALLPKEIEDIPRVKED